MVSAEYLDRIGFAAIRREPGDTSDKPMDALLCGYIEQARADMVRKGMSQDTVQDEENLGVTGCIQSYVRWCMAHTNKDSADNLEEYRLQLDEMRKSHV